jgi:ornithine decarboxylase
MIRQEYTQVEYRGSSGKQYHEFWVDSSGPEMPWPHDISLDVLRSELTTPVVLVDPRRGVEVADELALKVGAVRFAVKAGPYPELLAKLAEAGHGFDVASGVEYDLVSGLVGQDRILFSNPAMAPCELAYTLGAGGCLYVVDSLAYVEQLAEMACEEGRDLESVRVLIRIALADQRARFVLADKFGATLDDALPIGEAVRSLGLVVAGVGFHLGSQACDEAVAHEAGREAVALCGRLGIDDPIVDVGGGFPAAYPGEPTWGGFGEALSSELTGVSVLCEPGRVIASAGTWTLASVISVAVRDGARFIHLDAGAYHGLLEFSRLVAKPFGAQVALLCSDDPGETRLATLVGPTCDSLDILFGGPVAIPEGVKVGDRVLMALTGAYAIDCSSPFNGFSVPTYCIIGD